MDAEGLLTRPSAFDAAETLARLKTAIAETGLTLFAHIDHAAGARIAGLTLRPTDLLIFGDARAGTPLMAQDATIAIDLPLKALVWEGSDGRARLSVNDPAWLASRHHLGASAQPILAAMSRALDKLADCATAEAPR